METNKIILQASSFINYSEPITILPDLPTNEFYDVRKIVWKYRFGTSGFDYSDKIVFKLDDERIATLQADSLSSLSSVACVSNANLCIDKECPRVNLTKGVKLHLLGTPPTQGDGVVVIEIFFTQDNIWFN
jgi:hypothetical protein